MRTKFEDGTFTLSGRALARSIKKTLKETTNVVEKTLGPGGANILLGKRNVGNKITKDGVSVLCNLKPDDPVERAIITVLQDGCIQTNRMAGDGTTGTLVLINSIFKNVSRAIWGRKKINPISIRNGITKMCAEIAQLLKNYSTRIENTSDEKTFSTLKSIAEISTNGDVELSEKIAKAFVECGGSKAQIKIEASPDSEVSLKIDEGYQIPRGYLSPYFADEDGKVTFENPFIFVSEKPVSNCSQISSVIRASMERGVPLVIFAPKFEVSVYNLIMRAKVQNGLRVCLVLISDYSQVLKELMGDLAVVVGAKLISDYTDTGFIPKNPGEIIYGTAKSVTIDADKTTIIGGNSNPDEMGKRVEMLRRLVSEGHKKDFELSYEDRLQALVGGVGTVCVGGNTQARIIERMDLAEDAVNACRVAISPEGGYSPGGGHTLFLIYYNQLELFEQFIKTNMKNDSEIIGAKAVIDSLPTIQQQIAKNFYGNSEGISVLNKVVYPSIEKQTFKESLKQTLDLNTKQLKNALELGVIDPTEVLVRQILNAGESAGILLTMTSLVVEKPETQNNTKFSPSNFSGTVV